MYLNVSRSGGNRVYDREGVVVICAAPVVTAKWHIDLCRRGQCSNLVAGLFMYRSVYLFRLRFLIRIIIFLVRFTRIQVSFIIVDMGVTLLIIQLPFLNFYNEPVSTTRDQNGLMIIQ